MHLFIESKIYFDLLKLFLLNQKCIFIILHNSIAPNACHILGHQKLQKFGSRHLKCQNE